MSTDKKPMLVNVEESLNVSYQEDRCLEKGIECKRINSPRVDLSEVIKKYPEGESLYEIACRYIKRMRSPYFVKKNGKLDEAGFYTYACIDKNTWSNIRWNKTVPQKETLLKLIIALKLNMEEAEAFMNKGSNSLTDTDPRDRIIMALIDIRCYDIGEVYHILKEYGENGPQPFKNIY